MPLVLPPPAPAAPDGRREPALSAAEGSRAALLQFDVLVAELARHRGGPPVVADANAVLRRVFAFLGRRFGYRRFYVASPFVFEDDQARADRALDDATYLALCALRDPETGAALLGAPPAADRAA